VGWWKLVSLGFVVAAVSWLLQTCATPRLEHRSESLDRSAAGGAELDFSVSVDEPGELEVAVRNTGDAPELLRALEHCPPGTLHLYRAHGPSAGEFLPEEGAPILMRITSRDPEHDIGAYCAPADRVLFPLTPPRRLEPGAELSVRFRFSPTWSVASDREYEVPADWGYCSFALEGEKARRMKLMRCGSEPLGRLEPQVAKELPEPP
jgi:hypothetical protein